MDEGRFNLSELTELVREYLELNISSYRWVREFAGAAVPSVPTGTVSAGAIEFTGRAKGDDLATVVISIYLIDPTSEYGVEDTAMQVRDVLWKRGHSMGISRLGRFPKWNLGRLTIEPEPASSRIKRKYGCNGGTA